MIREVILVEVVNKADMSTDKSKAFTNTEKAESYFADLVREHFSNVKQYDIDVFLDNGFFDFISETGELSVIIKEISFEED